LCKQFINHSGFFYFHHIFLYHYFGNVHNCENNIYLNFESIHALWFGSHLHKYLEVCPILWLWTMKANFMNGVGTRLISYTFALELQNVNNGCVAMWHIFFSLFVVHILKLFVAFPMLPPSLPTITIMKMNLKFYELQVDFNMWMTMTIWDLCFWTRCMHSCSKKESLGWCLVYRTKSSKTIMEFQQRNSIPKKELNILGWRITSLKFRI